MSGKAAPRGRDPAPAPAPTPSPRPHRRRRDGVFSWVQGRSISRGLSPLVDPVRETYCIMTSLYGSMNPADSVTLSTQTHGAAFNLEYSPDGSVLTVACEQTEVLLFDPVSSKHIKTLSEAHEDCVNNIRCTEDGCPHKKFFHTRYLMRMRLTPDCSKMLISTSSGYLLILHDLDLTQSLEVSKNRSLRGKRSASNTDLTTSSCSLPGLRSQNHQIGTIRHSEKNPSQSCARTEREAGFPRNSLEVLTPEIPAERDRGNCITSLQLHPKGWATLIRCTSNTDDQEWTCIYEFQDGPPVRASSPRCSLCLTHYIEEANVGRGYIKELCFSPDGRLICSPFGYGIRLLGFDSQCNELCDCLPREATALQEIRTIYSHSDVVLTTKFSPTHCQLASGCLSGQVYLYQPKF
ncbi:DDB1- and CUL4-associated factor 10 isoform X2 [Mustelus asterias]